MNEVLLKRKNAAVLSSLLSGKVYWNAILFWEPTHTFVNTKHIYKYKKQTWSASKTISLVVATYWQCQSKQTAKYAQKWPQKYI